MKPKFKIGDKVKVIKYGSLLWRFKSEENMPTARIYREEGNVEWIDINPQIIGKEGIVASVGTYVAVDGIPEKFAWYDEEQLELIK